jgi:alcohol dehydrogenase
MVKAEKMARLAKAMGEPVEGLPLREASSRAIDGIRHLIRSVGLPACLNDLKITDTGKIARWAVEAHKEQRLLSRSPRILSVEDIQKIYENAFSEGSIGCT